MVLLSDDFFSLLPPFSPTGNNAFRFFKIARQLPMELQMVLAYRTFGMARILVPRVDSALALACISVVIDREKN